MEESSRARPTRMAGRSDLAKAFLDECTFDDGLTSTRATELYVRYQEYAREKQLPIADRCLGSREFGEMMGSTVPKVKKRDGQHYLVGIRP